MANKLPQTKIDAMFVAYQEKQNCHYVSQKVKVSYPAVRKYRDKLNWDERIARIGIKAIEKADVIAISRRAKDIKLVEAAKQVWAAQLTGKLIVQCPHCNQQHEITVPRLKPNFRDLPEFIRLSEFLAGEADSRQEFRLKVEHVLNGEKLSE